MAQNQQGIVGGLGQRVAPWRARALSGMQLSVSPPPPPILKQPGRAPIGVVAATGRAKPSLDGDWEDENEDSKTDVYAEGATLVFKKDAIPDDETTRELPGHAVRRLPVPSAVGPAAVASAKATLRGLALPSKPPSLPPRTSGGPWSSMPAVALPLREYAVPLLVRANQARTSPPRLGVGSVRVAAALAVAVVLALIAFELKPGQGKIIVNARDSLGGPVDPLEVFVDGAKAPCTTAPCYVACGKGVHEVKVVADGFEAPAAQGVTVSSGDLTVASFVVGAPSESGVTEDRPPIALDDGKADKAPSVPPEPEAPATPVLAALTRDPRATATPVLPALTRDLRATPSVPVYAAPAAPAPQASPPRSRGGGARGDGFLNINSMPPSACFLDGKPLGSTPRQLVAVSAGTHTVKFREWDRGSTKTLVVNVGVGETKFAVTKL